MLQKLRSAINELGYLEGLLYLSNRLVQQRTGSAVLYRYAIVAQPVAGEPLLPAHRGRDIEVRLLSAKDSILTALSLSDDVLEYRFRQGAVCLAAFQAGKLIGCLWLCQGPYEEDEVRCRYMPLPEGRASWDLGVYLLPKERGGVAFARLWDEANAYLRARGIGWSLSRIATVNLASLSAHKRLGAQRLGTATFLCLKHWQLMLSSLAPYVHLSTSPASRPVLRVGVSQG